MLDDKKITKQNIEDKSVQRSWQKLQRSAADVGGRITSKQIPYGDQTKW